MSIKKKQVYFAYWLGCIGKTHLSVHITAKYSAQSGNIVKEAVAKEIGKRKQSSATVYAAGDRDRTRDGQPVADINIEHAHRWTTSPVVETKIYQNNMWTTSPAVDIKIGQDQRWTNAPVVDKNIHSGCGHKERQYRTGGAQLHQLWI